MAKVLFFTADRIPTTDEQAAIDAITTRTIPQYSFEVRNVRQADHTGYATAADREQPDFVASVDGVEIPDQYAEIPVLDTSNMPTPGLADNQAVVSDGDVITGTGGSFTITVVDGAVTGGTWAADGA